MEKLLEVKNLCVNFGTYGGEVKAVRGVTFDLHKGETLAIVVNQVLVNLLLVKL